jgi:Type IX secretion system protein PorV
MQRNSLLRLSFTVLMIGGYCSSNAQITTDELKEFHDGLTASSSAYGFLTMPSDARTIGMAMSGSATSSDAAAIYWNVSRLAFTEHQSGINVSYPYIIRALIPDPNILSFSGYYRLDEIQVLGISLRQVSVKNIIIRSQATILRRFNVAETVADIAYSRKLNENFSAGITGRIIKSNLTGDLITGTGPEISPLFDIGFYYQSDTKKVADLPLRFKSGLSVTNIGPKVKYFDSNEKQFSPTNLRLGVALESELNAKSTLILTGEITKFLVPSPPIYALDSLGSPIPVPGGGYQIIAGKDPNISALAGLFGSFNDAPGGFRDDIREFTPSIGAEYWYDKKFAVRSGYFSKNPTKGDKQFFTFGAGIRYKAVGLDCAYLIQTNNGRSSLRKTLFLTLALNFDSMKLHEDRSNKN